MALLLYFDGGVLDEIKKIRYEDPRPAVQQKAEALILHAHGLSTKLIAEIIGVWPATIRGYFHQFKESGLEGLIENKVIPRKSEMHDYKDQLLEEFIKNPPTKVSEAKERIFQLTGLERGRTQVRSFLKSLGLKFRKTGVIPAKVDLEKQEEFKKKLSRY